MQDSCVPWRSVEQRHSAEKRRPMAQSYIITDYEIFAKLKAVKA